MRHTLNWTTVETRFRNFDVGSTTQYVFTLPDVDEKIWYENRDGGHADFSRLFNNQIHSTAGGFNGTILYQNGIVISNASSVTGETSEIHGSQSRVPERSPVFFHTAKEQWESGTIQFFPEHRDYDSLDWFKTNQPYFVTTQGSSSSEDIAIRRCLEIVKAIPADVRQWLIANKRVGDVISYLMRANKYDSYLNPMSHRVVINPVWWPTDADLALARSLTLTTIPPRIRIRLISDSLANPNRSTTTIVTDEVIGLKRLDNQVRTLQVEIVGDKPGLTYHWIKVQGDPVITFQNPEKTLATITLPYTPTIQVEAQAGQTIQSYRIDVAVVAHDGTHYSSPVFISEYFTPESRLFMPIADSIKIAGDDSFICRINGVELFRSASSWDEMFSHDVVWGNSDLIEIDVHNNGNPGGLQCVIAKNDQLTVSDSSWECSTDRVNWRSPNIVAPNGEGPWARQVRGVPDRVRPNWIWLKESPENSTVYFRKRIGAVVPEPEPQPEPQPDPTPQPTVIAECIAELEAVLSKLRGLS